MVYTKLERSFDSTELHEILKGSLKDYQNGDESQAVINKIERPPLPRGSTIFEQAKGEMEIERQTQYNGKHILPLPGRYSKGEHSHYQDGGLSAGGMAMCHLLVPACSPVPGHRGTSRPTSRTGARSCSSSGSRSGSRACSRSNSRPPSAKQRIQAKGQPPGQQAQAVSTHLRNLKTYRSSSLTPSIHKIVLNKTAATRPPSFWRNK